MNLAEALSGTQSFCNWDKSICSLTERLAQSRKEFPSWPGCGQPLCQWALSFRQLASRSDWTSWGMERMGAGPKPRHLDSEAHSPPDSRLVFGIPRSTLTSWVQGHTFLLPILLPLHNDHLLVPASFLWLTLVLYILPGNGVSFSDDAHYHFVSASMDDTSWTLREHCCHPIHWQKRKRGGG